MSIISVLKDIDTNIINMPFNASNPDDGLKYLKSNFFRMKHDIINTKKFLLNQVPNAVDAIGGIGEDLVILAAYQTGFLRRCQR